MHETKLALWITRDVYMYVFLPYWNLIFFYNPEYRSFSWN